MFLLDDMFERVGGEKLMAVAAAALVPQVVTLDVDETIASIDSARLALQANAWAEEKAGRLGNISARTMGHGTRRRASTCPTIAFA